MWSTERQRGREGEKERERDVEWMGLIENNAKAFCQTLKGEFRREKTEEQREGWEEKSWWE